MVLTDRVRDALLDALAGALATPGEHRLFKAGKLDGLFASKTGAPAEAASSAVAAGLLERVRVETRGKTEIAWVSITPKGVEFLHEHESPLRALHEFQLFLRANQNALPAWLDHMRSLLRALDEKLTADADRWHDRLQALDRRVSETLRRLEAAGPLVPDDILREHRWAIDALNYLDRRRTAGAPDACPLPELFAGVALHHPTLSIAGFHEGLKQLHRRKAVLLRAADSPEQMTSPEYALFDEAMVYYLAVR